MKIKELIVCAMAMALGFIASYIKIFAMPFGELLHCLVCFLSV